jgi:hypothetical protein
VSIDFAKYVTSIFSRFQALTWSPAIVDLNTVGIMHTNISETNMMVLRSSSSQGILVGFEFAILEHSSSPNKRVCSDPSPVSQSCTTDTDGSRGTTASTIPVQAPGDVTAHHVATLSVNRCMDQPPAHEFQNELESFIWSIFFIQCGFRSGRRIENPKLKTWYTGTWRSIKDAKSHFLRTKKDCTKFAGEFAESLGVDPQPMQACSHALADQLLRPDMLDAARLHSTLQEARDAYATSHLRENMADMA